MSDVLETESIESLRFELKAYSITQDKHRKEAFRELGNVRKAKLSNNESEMKFALKWFKINRETVNNYTDIINKIKEKIKSIEYLKVA
jgi:hypothetical protein